MLSRGEGSPSFSLRRAYGPLFFAAAIFYLSFQAFSGERGIFAYFKETRKLELLQAELESTKKQRAELEHRTRLMSSGSLDLDLLDEQSRMVLGVGAPGEVVLFTAK